MRPWLILVFVISHAVAEPPSVPNTPNEIIKQGRDYREELRKKDIKASNRVCIALKYLAIAESYLAKNREAKNRPLFECCTAKRRSGWS